MEIISIIAILIMAVSLLLTALFLISFLRKRSKVTLKRAAISFVVAPLSFSVLLVAEELFFSYNSDKKVEVLVASREASIGGILIKLYEDKTFEIGGLREVKSTGTFEIKSDTLFIIPKQNGYISSTAFILKEEYLEEIKDTGIGFLEIHVNKLR